MLFAVKNRWIASLLVALCLAIVATAAKRAFGLEWNLEFRAPQWRQFVVATFVVGVSDVLVHGLLVVALGGVYLSCYRALVEFFRPQGIREILAAGALAGAEELVFRGVLLNALVTRAHLDPWPAIGVSAVAFGMCHAIPRRSLWPFALWAVWEGALLGWAYTMSGSLTLVCLLHACHDAVGFGLFKWQRLGARTSSSA